MPPSCTVVICTRDRPEALDRCLRAVDQIDYPAYDALIVDNGSRDDSARAVAERWGARYAAEPTPGLSRARNRGARDSRAEILAYVDDDAQPEPSWLSGLTQELEDPAVMAVAGRIRPTSLGRRSEQLFEEAGGFTPNRQTRRVVDSSTPDWFRLANFGGIGTGANMAFRRRAFELWPGFDERLGIGAPLPAGEEHHAFAALIARGYRVVYTPDAVVRHPYPPTMEALRERHVRTIAGSAAYLLLSLIEAPGHRRDALRFALRSLLCGSSIPADVHPPGRRLGPFHLVAWAAARGALGYARLRLRDRPDTDASPPPIASPVALASRR